MSRIFWFPIGSYNWKLGISGSAEVWINGGSPKISFPRAPLLTYFIDLFIAPFSPVLWCFFRFAHTQHAVAKTERKASLLLLGTFSCPLPSSSDKKTTIRETNPLSTPLSLSRSAHPLLPRTISVYCNAHTKKRIERHSIAY